MHRINLMKPKHCSKSILKLGDWCLRLLLCTPIGACQKRTNECIRKGLGLLYSSRDPYKSINCNEQGCELPDANHSVINAIYN